VLFCWAMGLCVMMSVYGGAGWPPFSVAVLLPQLLTLICYGLNELNFLHIMYCTIIMPRFLDGEIATVTCECPFWPRESYDS
jgi:hypothetical protein